MKPRAPHHDALLLPLITHAFLGPKPPADRQIAVQIKTAFGRGRAYPANDAAHIFARMLGVSTLPPAALRDIDALGFTVVAVDDAGVPYGKVTVGA